MRHGPLLSVGLLLFAACRQAPPAPEAQDASWTSAWEGVPDRSWLGPAWWGNRLQDWRREGGRIACVESSPRYPLRTAMLLTRELAATGQATLEVELRPDPAGGWGGILLGAGGPEVDHRISAQVHHRPAEDGGMAVAVDAGGRILVVDLGRDAMAGGRWSIAGPLKEGELVVLAESVTPAREPADGDLRLTVTVTGGESGPQLQARCLDAAGQVLTTLAVGGFPTDRVDGLFGLVSHLGAADGSRGTSFTRLAVEGDMLRAHPERAFGPVLAVQYTRAAGVLKMGVQMGPLGAADAQVAHLELRDELDAPWREAATAALDARSASFQFRVEEDDARRAADYRIRYHLAGHGDTVYAGRLRAEPDPAARPTVVASLNCAKHYVGDLKWNGDSIWFPHEETVRHVLAHDPDLVFFAGDQLYEGDLDPVDARDEDRLVLDYLYKWGRWCWSFRELTRDRPTVTIPDDHDVYQGNLWGAGGRAAKADKARGLTAQDSGGYVHPPGFVRVVHRTQTGHLPDPADPAPSGQGIPVYFTAFTWGGLDLAVLADRQFKDSASDVVPDGKVVNGWFQAEGFDPRDADVPGASFLGARQEAFLEDWSRRREADAWAKVVLSQTPFVNIATIPEKASGGGVLPSLPVPEPGDYPEGYRLAADTDSGGWPQAARTRAVAAMARAGAVHLAGDQHLGSLVQYGVERHRDGGYAFTSPAIANTWPRRWWPPVAGADPEPGAPHYTGDFIDGFGNLMTVWAVANPVRSGREPAALYDRMPGYGIIRFDRAASTVAFECWPRWVDPGAAEAAQYPGWPRNVSLGD
jgi:alkaline phosphatase D